MLTWLSCALRPAEESRTSWQAGGYHVDSLRRVHPIGMMVREEPPSRGAEARISRLLPVRAHPGLWTGRTGRTGLPDPGRARRGERPAVQAVQSSPVHIVHIVRLDQSSPVHTRRRSSRFPTPSRPPAHLAAPSRNRRFSVQAWEYKHATGAGVIELQQHDALVGSFAVSRRTAYTVEHLERQRQQRRADVGVRAAGTPTTVRARRRGARRQVCGLMWTDWTDWTGPCSQSGQSTVQTVRRLDWTGLDWQQTGRSPGSGKTEPLGRLPYAEVVGTGKVCVAGIFLTSISVVPGGGGERSRRRKNRSM